MIGLTPQQRKLYDFIAATIAERGFAPTYGEMAAAFGGKSKSDIGRLLAGIEERGYIRRLPNRARAIGLVNESRAVTLNPEILTLTDRYAKEHGISRDTAANELLRIALGAAA